MINAGLLYKEAEEAFAALETVLGSDDWFFGASKPGLFDASVFSYTHLLLDESLGWVETRLRDAVLQQTNVVGHRNRILASYYAGLKINGKYPVVFRDERRRHQLTCTTTSSSSCETC